MPRMCTPKTIRTNYRGEFAHLRRWLYQQIPQAKAPFILGADHNTRNASPHPRQERIWDIVSRFPLRSLWNLQGIPVRLVVQRTWKSLIADKLFATPPNLAFISCSRFSRPSSAPAPFSAWSPIPRAE